MGNSLIQQVSVQWLILAALTLLTGSFTVRIPKIQARLSVSDTFVFASVLLFGPAAGTITVLLDALIISLRLKHPFREPFRVIFNVSLAALSTWIAAQIFFLSLEFQPYSIEQTPFGQILFPLFLFTLAYFLLNSWLVTFALALEQNKPPIRFGETTSCGWESTTSVAPRLRRCSSPTRERLISRRSESSSRCC